MVALVLAGFISGDGLGAASGSTSPAEIATDLTEGPSHRGGPFPFWSSFQQCCIAVPLTRKLDARATKTITALSLELGLEPR